MDPINYKVDKELGVVEAIGTFTCGKATLQKDDIFNEEFGKALSRKKMVLKKNIRERRAREREGSRVDAEITTLTAFAKKNSAIIQSLKLKEKEISAEIQELTSTGKLPESQ